MNATYRKLLATSAFFVTAALAAMVIADTEPSAMPVPRELPADVGAFTGRAVELAELDFLLPAAGQEPGAARGPVVISAVAGMAGIDKLNSTRP